MEDAIRVKNAITVRRSFYTALGRGKSIVASFNSALAGSALSHQPDGSRPHLIQENQQALLKLDNANEGAKEDVGTPILDSPAAKFIEDANIDADNKNKGIGIDETVKSDTSQKMSRSLSLYNESGDVDFSNMAEALSPDVSQDTAEQASDKLDEHPEMKDWDMKSGACE